MSTSPWVAQLRRGAVELCILGCLRQGENYGYAIVNALDESGAAFPESTVYPILARLCREGYLGTRTRVSEIGRKRRYYFLTARGRERLAEMTLYWRSLSQIVAGWTEGGK